MNKKKVYRLMKKNGLLCKKKRYRAKRKSDKSKPMPVKKNQWRGIDMTKFMVRNVGWVYLVVVPDWYTKKLLVLIYRPDAKAANGRKA